MPISEMIAECLRENPTATVEDILGREDLIRECCKTYPGLRAGDCLSMLLFYGA